MPSSYAGIAARSRHTRMLIRKHTHTHTCEGTISELTIEVIKLMMIIAPKNSYMYTHS